MWECSKYTDITSIAYYKDTLAVVIFVFMTQKDLGAHGVCLVTVHCPRPTSHDSIAKPRSSVQELRTIDGMQADI